MCSSKLNAVESVNFPDSDKACGMKVRTRENYYLAKISPFHLLIEFEKKIEVHSESFEVGTIYCFHCFQNEVKYYLNTNSNSA